jgi:hypothetical protein
MIAVVTAAAEPSATKPSSYAAGVPQLSRWSVSMLVTTTISAGYCKKEPSDSSASTTNGPLPSVARRPVAARGEPIT